MSGKSQSLSLSHAPLSPKPRLSTYLCVFLHLYHYVSLCLPSHSPLCLSPSQFLSLTISLCLCLSVSLPSSVLPHPCSVSPLLPISPFDLHPTEIGQHHTWEKKIFRLMIQSRIIWTFPKSNISIRVLTPLANEPETWINIVLSVNTISTEIM